MTKYLLYAFTTMKSNIYSSARLSHFAKYSQTFIYPVPRLRNNLVPLSKLLTRKCTSTPVTIQGIKIKESSYPEINTNVANNVILWKYENDKYFRNLKIFLVVQTIVFLTISFMGYANLPSIDIYSNFKEYIIENGIMLIIIIMPIITVFSAAAVILFFIKRSLKYIILNKGGEKTTFVIYHPTKGTIQRIRPVNDILIKKGRVDVGRYTTVRIKNSKEYYFIDHDGIYVNPHLFDCTVGALRSK